MGLRASFSVYDFGYPDVTPMLHLTIDYSEGCEVFVETFLEEAQDLCPVDTGYLLSSIDASTDGESCECVADTEYAQYVEYGTCFMYDQPYFEPAVAVALEAAFNSWENAIEDALDEEAEIIEEREQEEEQKFSERFDAYMERPIMIVYRSEDGTREHEIPGTIGEAFGMGIPRAVAGVMNFILMGILMMLKCIFEDMTGTKATKKRGSSSRERGRRKTFVAEDYVDIEIY